MNFPGAQMRLTAEFRSRDTGTLGDPTTVTLKVLDPLEVETDYTYAAAQIIKDAVGRYHMDTDIPNSTDSVGTWYYRWEITGALIGATEGQFIVKETKFG